MKKNRLIALCCAAAIFTGALAGCGTPATGVSSTDAPVVSESTEPAVDTSLNITEYEGYDLVWNDEFSGTELDLDKKRVSLSIRALLADEAPAEEAAEEAAAE